MREISFRAKCAFSGVTRYGFYRKHKANHIIVSEDRKESIVLQKTISQFTGILDKNGNKIFEGDKFKGDEEGEYYVVVWNKDEASFQVDLYGYNMYIGEGSQEVFDNEVSHIDSNCFELSALNSDLIIGNIHENGNK